MTPPTTTRLLLIRHGEIEANRTKVWHGSTDSALTDAGEAQARAVAGRLAAHREEPGALYTSPLLRARRTAELIGECLALTPVVEPALPEYGIGEWEGESYRDLALERRFFAHIEADLDFAPPGGESPRRVVERTVSALRRISGGHPGLGVVVVGHGAALAFALAQLIDGDPQCWQRYQMQNCAVTELVVEPDPQLLSFNETEHLGLTPRADAR